MILKNKKSSPPDKYERVPLWSKIALILCGICVILYIIICFNTRFADTFNVYVSSFFRFLLAQISNILPFSLAETTIILMPVILFFVVRYLIKRRCASPRAVAVSAVCMLSVASMFFSTFVLTFAAGYRGKSLESKLDFKSEKLTATDLYNSAEYLSQKINELAQEISYSDNGFSQMPYRLDVMNSKLISAYDEFCEEHTFIHNFHSRVKPVLISEAMSYAHITGVYTFFTGESNINVDFPDYTIPYTAAHELAHQRGIAREDEANMIAFLVSMQSDDIYIRYSAYVGVYEYVASALYRADKDLYRKNYSGLDPRVQREQDAYREFFKKYQHSVTSSVSNTVNDIYLQAQGTVGAKSYGMVVDMTVAYLKNQNLIPQ